MNGLICCVVFSVVVLFVSGEDDKACYDWDKEMKKFKEACLECKKETEVAKCLYNRFNLTDEEGNVLASKIRDGYVMGVTDEKIAAAIKDAIKDCGKDTEKMKERKEIDAVWKCADKSLIPVCPRMKEMTETWANDQELKGCMYEN